MAATVFLHIGLPKTATTYLQTILWGNGPVLAEQGMLLPGAGTSLPLLVHPDRAWRRHLRRAGQPASARGVGPVRADDRGLAGHRDRQSRVLRRGDEEQAAG